MKFLIQKITNINGKLFASISEAIVNECIQKGEDLIVQYGDDFMTISPNSLANNVVFTSPWFKDKKGGDDYRLHNYKWVPNKTEDD
jgi:hypothetical protein